MKQSSKTTAGLLGVDITDLMGAGVHHSTITSRRLVEVERRILAIEAALAKAHHPEEVLK
jgi:tRNA A-37 threonylcarbamoyl transferase component Bud32